ncbi:hypothetical protein [Alkalicoccobacillus plakortidis]|uniref:Uncharacterized protein n=1 Tax=Alkalicoccobacillus plakortidis TaxID=444060 RepID=A0ABT0XI86_9BACI|nr:hypothetical protein [Alkalicoccobacillus plakortidis]MCM2675608.1 hypothetical protein [Alkalicoccobacillus plakortidis]
MGFTNRLNEIERSAAGPHLRQVRRNHLIRDLKAVGETLDRESKQFVELLIIAVLEAGERVSLF